MVGLNDLDPGTANKKSFDKLPEVTDGKPGLEPGPSSTHEKLTGTNGDAQELYSQITAKAKLKDSANRFKFNGTAGEIIQVFDFTVPSEEADLKKKYTTLTPLLKAPMMDGSKTTPTPDATQMSDEELRDQKLHDEVVSKEQLLSFQDVIAKLEEVEGYDSESWGSAVEVSSSNAFYPKKLTSAMSQEEFEQFVNEDKESPQADKMEESVEVNGDMKHAGDFFGTNEYSDQCAVPTNLKQLPSSQEYMDFSGKEILDIPEEEITSTFVLDFVLRERDVEKHSVDMDKISVKVTNNLDQEDSAAEIPTPTDNKGKINDAHDTSEEKLIATSPVSNNVEKEDHEDIMCDGILPLISEEICSPQTEANTICKESNTDINEKVDKPESEKDKLETVESVGVDISNNQPVERAQIILEDVTEANLDPVDSFSIPDSRSSRRTRSPSPDGNSSKVSVTSTSSSHSSIRACSVRLTRLSLSPSPSRSYRSSAEDTSVGEILPPVATLYGGDEACYVQSDVEKSDETPDESKKQISSEGVTAVDEDELPLATIKTKLNAAKGMENQKTRKTSKRSVRIISVSSKSDDSLAAAGSQPQNYSHIEEEEEPIKIFEPIPIKVSRKSRQGKSEVKAESNVVNTPPVVVSGAENNLPVSSSRKRFADTDCEVAVKKEKLEEETATKQAKESISKMSKPKLINFMKQESKKDQPDFLRLSEAMSRTYEQRRKPIYDKGNVTLEDLKAFPELLHFEMVKEEYGRIKGDVGKMKALEEEFISGGILTAALEPVKKKTFKKEKKPKLCQDALKMWQEKKPDPQYHKVLGILAVCFSFAENNLFKSLCKVLKKGESLTNSDISLMQAPTIVVNEDDILNAGKKSEVWIYVDGAKFLEVPNIYEAVLTTFATYYLLNIDYPKTLKSLFEFFDMLNGNSQSTYNKTKKLFSLSD